MVPDDVEAQRSSVDGGEPDQRPASLAYSTQRPSQMSAEDTANISNVDFAACSSHRPSTSISPDDDEERNLYLFAKALREESSPAEPWFMEMTRLRRLHFLYLNKRLAAYRKKILETECATDSDMEDLGVLLHQQAEAIKDFEYIRTLDFLSQEEQEKRYQQSVNYFPQTGTSQFKDIQPFQTENYRCLAPGSKNEGDSDGVREFLRTYMPVQWSWSGDEKLAKPDLYLDKYKPKTLSVFADKVARFIVAITGALFILVPMYIMALHQNKTKNLVTTTVAVVLFATLCSVTLRSPNDQTLAATAGYAAVLMVFVGLTSQSGSIR